MKEIDRSKLGDAMREATVDVFQTMLGVEPEAKPVSSEPKTPNIAVGVVSFVGIAGAWSGTGSLVCSPRMACRIAGRFLMDEYTVVNEEVLDAFAEITNMIVGNVKNHLEDELGPMGLSVPTALFGRNLVTRTVGIGDWTMVPFEWDDERLEVHISLARQMPAPHAHLGNLATGCAVEQESAV